MADNSGPNFKTAGGNINFIATNTIPGVTPPITNYSQLSQKITGVLADGLGNLAESNPAVAPYAVAAAATSFDLKVQQYYNDIQAGGDLTSLAFFKKAFVDSASVVVAGYKAAEISLLGSENPATEELGIALAGVGSGLDLVVKVVEASEEEGGTESEASAPGEQLQSAVDSAVAKADQAFNAADGSLNAQDQSAAEHPSVSSCFPECWHRQAELDQPVDVSESSGEPGEPAAA